MSEAPVNIVKLAVGVQSVEELVLIQKRFLNQPGVQTSKGFYHSTKLMPKKHEAIVELVILSAARAGVVEEVSQIIRNIHGHC